jgi:hypothetical protein
MKKLAFSLLAAVLLFGACKKDDDKASSGSFTIDGKSYQAPKGLLLDYGADGQDLSFSNADYSTFNDFTGKVNAVDIELKTFTADQTYTYLSSASDDYDNKKNFSYASVISDLAYIKGLPDPSSTTGDYYYDLKGGSVTIKKNGDRYTVSYTLEFADATVKGQYEGSLPVIKGE